MFSESAKKIKIVLCEGVCTSQTHKALKWAQLNFQCYFTLEWTARSDSLRLFIFCIVYSFSILILEITFAKSLLLNGRLIKNSKKVLLYSSVPWIFKIPSFPFGCIFYKYFLFSIFRWKKETNLNDLFHCKCLHYYFSFIFIEFFQNPHHFWFISILFDFLNQANFVKKPLSIRITRESC